MYLIYNTTEIATKNQFFLKHLFLQYNALKVVGGESGKGCGEQVTMALFNIVFNEEIQPKMTWTGKTNKKDMKKIALKSFTKITKLLTSLSQAADVKYTDALFAKTIIYKILKYAYRGNSSNDDASDARSSTEETIIIEIPADSSHETIENPVIQVGTSAIITSRINSQ